MLLQNCAVDFVETCNVCTRKVIVKAAKRIFNSDKICRSYCDFYFGVTFLEHTAYVSGYILYRHLLGLVNKSSCLCGSRFYFKKSLLHV